MPTPVIDAATPPNTPLNRPIGQSYFCQDWLMPSMAISSRGLTRCITPKLTQAMANNSLTHKSGINGATNAIDQCLLTVS